MPKQRESAIVKHRYSDLTGETFILLLERAKMNLESYAWLTGQSLDVVMSLASGKRDGKIPEPNKLALEYINRYPDEMLGRARRLKERGLPKRAIQSGIHPLVHEALLLKEKDIPQARLSDLSGSAFSGGLKEVGWSLFDFARLTGYSSDGIYDLASQNNGRGINELMTLCWEYVRRHPLELQARPVLKTPIKQSRSRTDAIWRTSGRQPEAC